MELLSEAGISSMEEAESIHKRVGKSGEVCICCMRIVCAVRFFAPPLRPKCAINEMTKGQGWCVKSAVQSSITQQSRVVSKLLG